MIRVEKSMDGICDQQDRGIHLLKKPLFTEKAVEDQFLGFRVKAREDVVQDDQFLPGVDGPGEC